MFLADVPEFISTRRLQARFEARIRICSRGLERSEWVVRNGFAVTSAARTLLDLAAAGHDGGYLGRFASDAIAAGVDPGQLQAGLGRRGDIETLLEMAAKSGTL